MKMRLPEPIGVGLLACIATAVTMLMWFFVADQISSLQQQKQIAYMHEVFASVDFDQLQPLDMQAHNDSFDLLQLYGNDVWIAWTENKVQAVAVHVGDLDGFGGIIFLWVVICADGTLCAVHVTEHNESRGYGAVIANPRFVWIQSLLGYSLATTPVSFWSVREDNGDFDAISSATVTSRAVLSAIRQALLWYAQENVKQAIANNKIE